MAQDGLLIKLWVILAKSKNAILESFVEGRIVLLGQLMATYNKSWGKHRLGYTIGFLSRK